MENNTFNKTTFTKSLNNVKKTNQKIEELKQKANKHYQELDAVILESLISCKWAPYYNEKAVYVMLEDMTAWHVWFLEEDTGYFRFREAPNEYTDIRNFYRQSSEPSPVRKSHEWIIPMWLFQEINRLVKFDVYEDKYLTYKKNRTY